LGQEPSVAMQKEKQKKEKDNPTLIISQWFLHQPN
jgi:hypothetical protein